nr:metallophosphoesterase [Streptomyces sp. SID13031]
MHISDTQFGQYHHFGEGVDSLASALVRDLAGLSEPIPPIDLIILSGDITERSLKPEYEQALAFIDVLCQQTGLGRDRVVVVPGNHDVSWHKSKIYFEECAEEGVAPKRPYTKKWSRYQEFVAALHGATAFTEEQPYRLHSFEDLRVVVAAFNSTIQESHVEDDHYGLCGREQLHWFNDRLGEIDDVLRIGVVHHNPRRGDVADNENLQDADQLTRIVGPRLDVLLHGHTHAGKEDRLADNTLVLATGSSAIDSNWRPAEVPNQYQILHFEPDRLSRWARQWDRQAEKWIADTRISPDGNHWHVTRDFQPPGWQGPPLSEAAVHDRRERDRPEIGLPLDDLVTRIEYVTRRDVGEASIDRRKKGNPPLDYLMVVRPAAPRRCVGILDRPLDAATLDRFEELVFSPLRERAGTDFVVVYNGPDDPPLRAEARRRGVQIKTIVEYNDLLEPRAYSDWLRSQLESDTLYRQDLYMPQRFRAIDRWGKASQDVQTDMLGEIYDGVLDEEGRFFLILGDAGYGKSFLVRKLAYQMVTNDWVTITPIVISLRNRDKGETIGEMVSSVMIPSRSAFNIDRFEHSLEAGSLALLIDGYDEFAVRVGYQNAAAQLQTFIQALRGRAKVLLTTRPNHFRSTDEATSKLFDSLRTVHEGRVYQLEPFDDSQQRNFLTRWFTLKGDAVAEQTADRWMQALHGVDNLPDLAKTPRMLSFMVEDLSIKEIEAAPAGTTLKAADLYQKLVRRWLTEEADKVDPDDERKVPPEVRQRALEELALELWRGGDRDVNEDALHRVARKLDLPRYDLTLDQAAQLLGGRTLLQIDERQWRFAHQSVWEFLLASRLAAILREQDYDKLGEAQLTGLTIRFLRDLAPAEAMDWVARFTDDSA